MKKADVDKLVRRNAELEDAINQAMELVAATKRHFVDAQRSNKMLSGLVAMYEERQGSTAANALPAGYRLEIKDEMKPAQSLEDLKEEKPSGRVTAKLTGQGSIIRAWQSDRIIRTGPDPYIDLKVGGRRKDVDAVVRAVVREVRRIECEV